MLGIRWTIADLNPRGFEALRRSIWDAWSLFGAKAGYWVFVNTVSVRRVRDIMGPVPGTATWHTAAACVPEWLQARALDAGLAGSVAWKLAPLQCFPDRRELAVDDVFPGDMPEALAAWLADDSPKSRLHAEEITSSVGQFGSMCGIRALNTDMRGLPAGFDLEARLRAVLDVHLVTLVSELDKQGLQAAARSLIGDSYVVSVRDVTTCSPCPPHLPHLGRCGAHVVGWNAKRFGWDFYGEPAENVRAYHKEGYRPALPQFVELERFLHGVSRQVG